MKIHQILCSGFVAVSLLSYSVIAGSSEADKHHDHDGSSGFSDINIIFNIDESASMSDDIAAVRANLNTIANSLPLGSYGSVVGFGYGTKENSGEISLFCDKIDLKSDMVGFDNCLAGLRSGGSDEPGYDTIIQTAEGLFNHNGNPYCNILISDEPSNNDDGTLEDAIDAITDAKGVFFGIPRVVNKATESYEPIAAETGGQMFDLAAFKLDPSAVLTSVLQACVVAVDSTNRMTGGGKFKDEKGIRISHGFTLHCNKNSQPNNLQVNWAGHRFHMEELEQAVCSDNANYDEGKPIAGFDTFMGSGNGRLNGKSGATVEFGFTDQGEPGKNGDTVYMMIKDEHGTQVLNATGSINKGNQQAHK